MSRKSRIPQHYRSIVSHSLFAIYSLFFCKKNQACSSIKIMDFLHKMISFLVLTVALVASLCSGQEDEVCRRHLELTPVHNFSVDKILGEWVGWKLFAGLRQDALPPPYRCLESNITRNGEGPFALAFTETVRNLTGSGEPESGTSNVTVSEDVPAVWKIFGGTRETDSVFLQTDYSNWALQFGCTVMANYRYEFLIVWTRSRSPDPKTMEILDVLAANYGFPMENVMPVDQTNC